MAQIVAEPVFPILYYIILKNFLRFRKPMEELATFLVSLFGHYEKV